MNRVIHTTKAPEVLGPYSQAISSGEFVFAAGQIGIDPSSGSLVPGGIATETQQAMANMGHVLAAAGTGLDRIVKVTVFLVDLADFPKFNTVYAELMSGHRPARSTVQVAGLPANARVEIEAIAARY